MKCIVAALVAGVSVVDAAFLSKPKDATNALAKEMTHDIEMNFNKIAPFGSKLELLQLPQYNHNCCYNNTITIKYNHYYYCSASTIIAALILFICTLIYNCNYNYNMVPANYNSIQTITTRAATSKVVKVSLIKRKMKVVEYYLDFPEIISHLLRCKPTTNVSAYYIPTCTLWVKFRL